MHELCAFRARTVASLLRWARKAAEVTPAASALSQSSALDAYLRHGVAAHPADEYGEPLGEALRRRAAEHGVVLGDVLVADVNARLGRVVEHVAWCIALYGLPDVIMP